jgi:hypothetical protein
VFADMISTYKYLSFVLGEAAKKDHEGLLQETGDIPNSGAS